MRSPIQFDPLLHDFIDQSVFLKEYIEKYSDFAESLQEAQSCLDLQKLENLELAVEEIKKRELVVQSSPPKLLIDPTNFCNLRCPLCPTGLQKPGRKQAFMDLGLYKDIIDQVYKTAVSIGMVNWGEPTLHRQFNEMVKYAAKERNLWVSTSTNFSRTLDDSYLEELVESGLHLMLVDVDGTTQETYEQYRRRGDLSKVLDNVSRLMKIKQKRNAQYPIVEAGMMVMQHNEHQVDDFAAMMKDMGVDKYTYRRVQFNPNVNVSWFPKNEEYRYNNYEDPNYKAPKCDRLWMTLVVNSDGSVSSCCLVDDEKADFGDTTKNRVSEIWNNDYFQSARSVFSDNEKSDPPTICHICRNELHKLPDNRVGDSFALKL